MRTHAAALGLGTALVCSLPFAFANSTPSSPVPARAPVEDDAVGAEIVEPLAPSQLDAAPDPAPPVRGARLGSVPAELAAHLGLEVGEGLLVLDVLDGGAAEEGGLEPFDVVVSVDREAVTGARELREALESGRRASLTVLRGGVEERVVLRSEPGVPDDGEGFLSTDALPEDHPLNRLTGYRALQQRYAERREAYGDLIREIEEQSREAQREAKESIVELRERAMQDVEAWAEQRRTTLNAFVDHELDRLAELGFGRLVLDLDELADPARGEELTEAIAAVRGLLHEDLGERLLVDLDASKGNEPSQARSRLTSVGREAASLVGDRVQEDWRQYWQDVRQHGQRVGPQTTQRVEWTEGTLAKIREELHARIDCAYHRTVEDFERQLARRLSSLEVPAPGEIDQCLDEMDAQIVAMAHGFLDRTREALGQYDHRVSTENALLVPQLASGMDRSAAATDALRAAVEEALAKHLPAQPLVLDGGWRGDARLDTIRHGLRAALRVCIADGSDGVRDGVVPMADALREHRVATDDAWRDLQELLGEIRQVVGNDCWHLDGPHLDGRFPTRPSGREIASLER